MKYAVALVLVVCAAGRSYASDHFYVYQTNMVDIIAGMQVGPNNVFGRSQAGAANLFNLTQVGPQNTGYVSQQGYHNIANITQIGAVLPFISAAP
ncbi:MAG: curlin repeat-containing protein [Methylocystis sp.]|uniref:curlin repeat-containing protein n=1 Tax=Methylocystis sp. TaxID=1911079 RepID=UPI003DA57598